MFIVFSGLVLSCKNNKKTSHEQDIKKQEGIIQFVKSNPKKGENIESEILESFTLYSDESLAIHFTLDQPLIKSLQVLDPGLSTEELLNKGNFQFSILVDEKVIYVENLHKGAGLKDSKIIQRTHTIPLISPEPLDYWGWFMWLKFMKMNGGQDVLSEGKHQLSIQVRSYLQNDELIVGEVLAEGSIAMNVAEIPFDKNEVELQEIEANSGWKVSEDSFDRTKIEVLNKNIAQKRFEKINGIVVIKEGELLIEEYFNGEDRESLHDPRSVGKTIASTMLGIAIADEHIESEALPLKNFYDLASYKNHSVKKDSVTLRSLLTMSSGFLGDDSDNSSPGNENNMYPTDNWVKFALDLPVQEDRVMGKDFSYFTAGVVVLGDVIDKLVPDGLIAYADQKLFSPLNIKNYKWQYTPQGVGNTAGGIQLRAIDFAKYGQLYKNKGKWNGRQLLSEDWVEKSFSRHVKQPNRYPGFYGYLFWNKVYTINGNDYEVSYCSGNGGNKIFVFKDIPFVIVITSSAYNLPYAHSDVDKMMADYILPAIIGAK